MKVELCLMAGIYSTAYLTLLTVDGIDSSYGLRGFKVITQARDIKQNIISLAGCENLIIPIHRYLEQYQKPEVYIYHACAWTYQEYRCAKRQLIFENQTVYWQCDGARWREEQPPI